MSNKRKTSADAHSTDTPHILAESFDTKDERASTSASFSNHIMTRSQLKRRRVTEGDSRTSAEQPVTTPEQQSTEPEPEKLIPGLREPSPPVTEKVAKRFSKHPKHWLLDGSILVQIEETRFKLHRSTLVKHSEWFRQMVEDPPHTRCLYVDEETRERVYCLDSLEVSIDDFVALLDVLDNAIELAMEYPPFRTIASFLRAADALEFKKFKQFAVDVLNSDWPSDVSSVTTSPIKYAAETIALALKCNVPSVLKRAYYELLRSEGFRQETDDEDVVHTLSEKEYALLVKAREKLVAFWVQKASPPAFLLPPRDRQHNADDCLAFRSSIYKFYTIIIHSSGLFSSFMYDPICGLSALIDAPLGNGAQWVKKYEGKDPIPGILCPMCCSFMKSVWKKEREELWDDLGEWLELVGDEEMETEVEDSEGSTE